MSGPGGLKRSNAVRGDQFPASQSYGGMVTPGYGKTSRNNSSTGLQGRRPALTDPGFATNMSRYAQTSQPRVQGNPSEFQAYRPSANTTATASSGFGGGQRPQLRLDTGASILSHPAALTPGRPQSAGFTPPASPHTPMPMGDYGATLTQSPQSMSGGHFSAAPPASPLSMPDGAAMHRPRPRPDLGGHGQMTPPASPGMSASSFGAGFHRPSTAAGLSQGRPSTPAAQPSLGYLAPMVPGHDYAKPSVSDGLQQRPTAPVASSGSTSPSGRTGFRAALKDMFSGGPGRERAGSSHSSANPTNNVVDNEGRFGRR